MNQAYAILVVILTIVPALIHSSSALERVYIRALPALATLSTAPENAVTILGDYGEYNAFIGPRRAVFGFGMAARIDAVGANGIAAASKCWSKLISQVALDTLDTSVESLNFPIALGSFGFTASTNGVLIVPQHAIIVEGAKNWIVSWDESWLPDTALVSACNTLAKPQGTTSAQQTQKRLPIQEQKSAQTQVKHQVRHDLSALTEAEWVESVSTVIELLRRGDAEKVVLARDLVIDMETKISQPQLLQRLGQRYPTCWRFAVAGLIGATPEMIASVNGGRLQCRVLAGTALPGAAHILSKSVKDLREHDVARECVIKRLRPIVSTLKASDKPFILELPNVCHLATDIEAEISKDTTSLDIAGILHPTAAVCGTPREVAAQIIAEYEYMNRGRYAGPVGWIDASGDGEWALALRLGQIDIEDQRRIRLYAGGGIMSDSVPANELAETKMKMQPMLDALGVNL